MGGQAFNQLGYMTPRVPTAVYNRVVDHCEAVLGDGVFQAAKALRAGPWKKDHGDVDMVVAEPLATILKLSSQEGGIFPLSVASIDWDRVAVLLGAVDHIDQGTKHFFWLPLEGELRTLTCEYLSLTESTERRASAQVDDLDAESQEDIITITEYDNKSSVDIPIFIQVDLSILGSVIEVDWHLEIASHGDKLSCLNLLLRPLGLVICHNGLNLRVAEIEKAGETGRACRVLVTRDWEKTVRFLRLTHYRCERISRGVCDDDGDDDNNGTLKNPPFQTEEDLFAWIISSPFFGPPVIESLLEFPYDTTLTSKRGTSNKSNELKTDDPTLSIKTETQTSPSSPKPTKSKKSLSKREMYTRFIHTYLPVQIHTFKSRIPTSRAEILVLILEKFKEEGVQERFQEVLEAFRERRRLYGNGRSAGARRRRREREREAFLC